MWRLTLLVFTVATVLFAAQVRIDYAYAGIPISWGRALILTGADWYTWAALTPLIAFLGRRFSFSRPPWLRSLLVHGLVCLVLVFAKSMANEMLIRAFGETERPPASFLQIYVSGFTYWIILGFSIAIRQYRDRQDEKLRASRLEAELVRAQLDTLQLRLHPHFLFNTLNGVLGLMREDVDAADRMLTRLSELLRGTLDTADEPEQPLGEEIRFIEKYFEIHQIRFGDRLTTSIQAEPDTLGCLVPSLSLQPLVENAFRHGVSRKAGPVSVAVEARLNVDELQLQVTDNGPGPTSRIRYGTGLETTTRRLKHLYGSNARLEIEAVQGGGTQVTLTLPRRLRGAQL